MDSLVLCPRCRNEHYTPYGVKATVGQLQDHPFPALSRMDNETYICSSCGTDEGLRDWLGDPPIPPNEWPVPKTLGFPAEEC